METDTVYKMVRGNMNPLEAAQQINREIGGITRVEWNPGNRKYKIYNHNQARDIKLPVTGCERKAQTLIMHLAVISYLIAQSNGNWMAGEMHINESFSSKHHDFKEKANAILASYTN